MLYQLVQCAAHSVRMIRTTNDSDAVQHCGYSMERHELPYFVNQSQASPPGHHVETESVLLT